MKFRCVFLLTFWYTLYISEKSTAKVILEDGNTDIQPADESSNVIREEMFQIDTKEITAMRNGILFPPPNNDSSNFIIEEMFQTDTEEITEISYGILFPPPTNESSSATFEKDLKSDMSDIIEDMSDMTRKGKKSKSARNCHELHKQNKKLRSGIYFITPCDAIPAKVAKVWCDMDTDGGGFTVIQRRGNYAEQQDFYLTWNEYALGFGDVAKDFYLGNENINCLTKQSYNEIRFDLADWDGTTRHAAYDFFYISDESEKYKLSIGNYTTGTAGDSFSYQANMTFTTKDTYHNGCAKTFKGGWWYNNCYLSNLNGVYNGTSTSIGSTGLAWQTWTGYYYSLMHTEMKIRPKY